MDKSYYTIKLIDDFKTVFIDHQVFSTLFFYRFPEQDASNADRVIQLWNQTASSVDAVSLVINDLQNKLDDYEQGKINDGLKLSSLLNDAQILVNSIQNLWTVFEKLGVGTYPERNDDHIFPGKIIDRLGNIKKVTDDTHFQFLINYFDMRNLNGQHIHNSKRKLDFNIIPEIPSFSKDNQFIVVIYCDNDAMDDKYGGILKLDIADLFLYIGDRYNSLQKLASDIDGQFADINNATNERTIPLKPDQNPLERVKELHKFAQKYPDTSNYYTEDILLYINFLELWGKKDENKQFATKDKSLINEYIQALNTKLLPEYQAALDNFDPDLNLQNADLLHLTPRDNKANLHDYVELEQYFNTQLTPNVVIESINDINKPIDNLIKRGELPKYAKQLNWLELYLLINAIAYHHWFDHKN